MQGGGLSVQTLIIASVSSLAAAIVIHEFWPGGSILAAAVTPVIIALVSEGLRRPTERITRVRGGGRQRRDYVPPTERAASEPQHRGLRLNRSHALVALATGVVAFVIAGVALTGAELVFGGNAGGGDNRTTLLGGDDRDRPTTTKKTTPAETVTVTTPQPTTTEEQPPAETETTPTTPTTPTTTTAPPPASTVPVPPEQP